MLKTLIKKQLLELFQTYYIDRKTGKARNKKGTVMFFILLGFLFICLGLAFFSMASSLGATILNNGANWLYFALMGLLSMALGVFGSVFNTYASLYLPKDNEFVLSLPIPPRTLLLARLSGVYVTSLMYSAWVWIPVMIAYWTQVPVTACSIIFPMLLTFVIALFVSVLSALLGYVVAIIAQKAKGKSFLTVALSLMVMVLYYVVYFKIINSLSEIASHLDSLGSTFRSWLHYVYLLGRAADGDGLSMLLVSLITAALAALCVYVLSHSFLKLAISDEKTKKKTLRGDEYISKSSRAALLRREYGRFTSVPIWMLNGGFGLLIMPLLAVAALIKSASIRGLLAQIASEDPDLAAALPVVLLAGICLIISTNAITQASVSIEGKSLWIIQSLPVEPRDILSAKLRMGVQLNIIPAMLLAVAAGFVFQLKTPEFLLLIIAVAAFILVDEEFGLVLNLKFPNLNWTNATAITKQGIPVTVGMFGGWLFCAAFGFAGFYVCRLLGTAGTLAAYAAVFIIIWYLLRRWLNKKGTDIIAYLQ